MEYMSSHCKVLAEILQLMEPYRQIMNYCIRMCLEKDVEIASEIVMPSIASCGFNTFKPCEPVGKWRDVPKSRRLNEEQLARINTDVFAIADNLEKND